MPVITTNQAPAAKPVAANLLLTTTYQTLVEAPIYIVPRLGFNVDTVNARGVVEFSSPLIVTNISTSTQTFSVRITRTTTSTTSTFAIANAIVVEPNDVLPFPLNGQFLIRDTLDTAGDKLEVLASANNAIVVTISYTEGQAEDDDVT